MTACVRFLVIPSLLLSFPLTASTSDDPTLDGLEGGSLQGYEELLTDLDTLRSSSRPVNLRIQWSRTSPPSLHTTGVLQTSRLLQRIILDSGRWNGRLIIEKDPGETRMTDFIAGYSEVKRWAGLDRLVIGDFRPGFAQGLIFSRLSRVIFSPDLFKRYDSGSIGYNSTAENGALRGVMLTKRAGPFMLSGFISHNRFDASTGGNGLVLNRRESGLHVTTGERNGHDIQHERLIGWRWRISRRRMIFGNTGLIAGFTPPFGVGDSTKDPFAFQGSHLHLTGLDWDVTLTSKVSFFGEVALTGDRHSAHLTGLKLSLPHADFRILSRYYAADFYSPYGAGISASGETRNESGILGFIRWRPVRSTTIIVWGDRFQRPGGVFSQSATASGSRFGLSGHRRLGHHYTIDLNLRVKIDTHGQLPVRRLLKHVIHSDMVWEPDDWIRLRWRTEIVRAYQPEGTREKGLSASIDLDLHPFNGCAVEWRTTTFSISSYDVRIIEIEYDAPNTMTPVVLIHPGIKHHITVSYGKNDRRWFLSYRIKRDLKTASSRLFLGMDIGF
jgi:hypothetical protein